MPSFQDITLDATGSVAGGDGLWRSNVLYGLIGPPVPAYSDRTKLVTAGAAGGGDGSEVSPWTLAEAMANAVAGDIVGIQAGIYTGTGVSTGGRSTPVFQPANSGTALNPITFVAENEALTSTSGFTDIRSGLSYPATPATDLQPAFGGNGEDYIHWVGIYSSNFDLDNAQRADSGICTIWNGVGCKVLRCKLLADSARTVNWADNNFSGVRLENTSGIEIAENLIDGFSISGGGVNMSGVISYKSENSNIHNNTIVDCGNALQYKASFGTYNNSGLQAYKNLVVDCGQFLRVHALHGGISNIYNNGLLGTPILMSSNTAEGVLTQTNIRVFNNTLSGDFERTVAGLVFISIDWVGQGIGTPSGIELFNNIIASCNYYAGSKYITGNSSDVLTDYANYDHNCQYNNTIVIGIADASSLNWAQWQALSEDVNSITSDPMFVSPSDFHLQAGSPSLTAGKDVHNFYGGGIGSTIPQGAYVTGSEQIGNGVPL